jgi:hypothetical protein
VPGWTLARPPAAASVTIMSRTQLETQTDARVDVQVNP